MQQRINVEGRNQLTDQSFKPVALQSSIYFDMSMFLIRKKPITAEFEVG